MLLWEPGGERSHLVGGEERREGGAGAEVGFLEGGRGVEEGEGGGGLLIGVSNFLSFHAYRETCHG